MRDRLIELMKKADGYASGVCTDYDEAQEVCADFLLAEGVIVPPVKVGQTVYRAYIKGFGEEEVLEVGMDDEGVFFETTEARYYEWHFNKCVYFSREEAEKALKETHNE